MSMSELYPSGPGTPYAQAPPHECHCHPGRVTATLDATLNCPGTWYELDDGWWAHAWPFRRRGRNRTETTTRGNRT